MAKAARRPERNAQSDVDGQSTTWIIVGVAVIVLLTVLAYVLAIRAGYIWDDESYVTDNFHLRTLDGLRLMWIPKHTPQYYPAVFSMFWIEYQLWQLRPMGYHIVNVLLHAGNALLVWRLARKLGIGNVAREGSTAAVAWAASAPAWLIGAVFALHPVHVESVAWITERKNVLSGFLYLLAALCYLRFDAMRFESSTNIDRKESRGWYGSCIILFALALLSKSVTCSLPAALILMMLYQRRRLSVVRLAPLVPMFVLGLVMALNTAMIEREHVGAEGPEFAFSFADRLLIASRALLFYPWKILWPSTLIFIYPRWEIDSHDWRQYWSVLAVAFIAGAAIVAYLRGWRGVPLAIAFFAGTIFPALGFFNVYPMLFSFVADHFQYLASLGIIAAAIGTLAWFVRSNRVIIAIACILLPLLAMLTWRQARNYRDIETLWRATLAVNNRAWMPHNNLASFLLGQAETAQRENRPDDVRRLAEEAMRESQSALAIKPDHHPAMTNLSESLRLLGRYDEALVQAHAAETKAPELPQNHWAVGRLLQLLNRPDEAIAEYERSLQLDPKDRDALFDLAMLLVNLGRFDQAMPHVQAAIAREPGNVKFLLTVGRQFDLAGRYAQAIDFYRRAVDAARDDAQTVDAGYFLAQALAMNPDQSLRNGNEAVRISENICALTNRTQPQLLGVLAASYAQAGRFDDAIRTAQEALALSQQLNQTPLAKEMERRISLYRAGKTD